MMTDWEPEVVKVEKVGASPRPVKANKKKLMTLGMLVALLILGVIAVQIVRKQILGSRANLTSQAVESESGILVPPGVSVGSDTTASGGQYVEFGFVTSPTPPGPTATVGPTLPPSACNRFVALNGSDSNPGTETQPWRTINTSWPKLTNGQTMCVRGGNYGENLLIKKIATATGRITIKNYPGETPVVRKIQLGGWNANREARYLNVSGFEVAGSADYGVQNFGEQNIVSDLYIHDAQMGGVLIADSANSEFYNLRVMNNVKNPSYNCRLDVSGGWPATFNISSSSYIYAHHNTIGNNCGEGMNAYDYTNHIHFANNVVYDNWSVEMYMDHTNDSIYENNLIYGTGTSNTNDKRTAHGISIANETRLASCDLNNLVIRNNFVINTKVGINNPHYNCASDMKNSIIENNTLVNNWEAGIKLISAGSSTSVRNNIVYNRPSTGQTIWVPYTSGYAFLNNMVYQGGGITWGGSSGLTCQQWVGLGGLTSNLCNNPQLVNPGGLSAEANKLNAGSPAADAGMISTAVTDYFGTLRIAPFSIGAHEGN